MSNRAPSLVALVLAIGAASLARAHCEIPCGIYDDEMRILAIQEDVLTVEKSMASIRELSAEAKPNWNQLVRWVTNKEEHAERIQHVVTQYFLTQRIKLPKAGDEAARSAYLDQLATLHELLVTAMKLKQTTDQASVDRARELVDAFAAQYFSPKDLKHLRSHG